MTAKKSVPDNYTYQEVINWLCKKGKRFEGLRVFNDLKDIGCTMSWIGEATKLWFEMIEKGYHPNDYTYNT